MPSPNKKWSSFEEMYLDLKDQPQFKDSARKTGLDEIRNIAKAVEEARTGKEFFDLTCKLSSIFESLDEKTSKELVYASSIYIFILNAALRNKVFIEILLSLLNLEKPISVIMKDKETLGKLVFVNTAISLGFFGISLSHTSINKVNVEFFRKNTTDLLKYILKQSSNHNINFVSVCFFLERIIWDKRFHYNENFDSKYPIKLNDQFLFNNLRNARSFAGITFTSLSIRPAIEAKFKKVIRDLSNEGSSISFSLNSIYEVVHDLREKTNHYYRATTRDIVGFFDIFIQSNEKNLLFCIEKFCTGFHYQGKEKKFYEIILEKLQTVSGLRNELVAYTKSRFKAFNKELSNEDDEWTNKLFLISIKILSLLDEIKHAHDKKWAVSATVFELHRWVFEVHEVLNKYYIEDDWDKIKDLVIQESEKIEWKSNFFTPLEQEFIDEGTNQIISKKLFEKVLKVILAMLNTDGGVLLVGVVENPENLKREDLRQHLFTKNSVTFFNVNEELKRLGKTLDNVRLQVLDSLKVLTDTTADNFNGLIDFEPITLRNENQVISIVQISIKKAPRLFFTVKKEGTSVWISLTKRANGQNVDADIREHI